MNRTYRFLQAFFNDRWINGMMNALAVALIVSILVPAGSVARNVAEWIGIALLAGLLARAIAIGWQLHRGRLPKSEPAAVVQRRERIGMWVSAAFFLVLLAVALLKLLLRIGA